MDHAGWLALFVFIEKVGLSSWKAIYRLFYCSSTCLAAWWVFNFFLRVSGINSYARASLEGMVYGHAYRPYVYRALLPMLTRCLTPLVSHFIASIQGWPWFTETLERLGVSAYPSEAFLVGVGMYFSLVGFVFALRWLMLTLGYSGKLVDWTSGGALFGLLPMFLAGYLYDFPTLCLFTLSLALMVKQLWKPYLGMFLLASLNKETSLLLTLVFLIHFWRSLERKRYYALLVTQLCLWGVIRLGLMWFYRDNLGSMVEFHLLDHLYSLQTFPAVAVGAVLFLAGLIAFIIRHWRGYPLFLRDALVMLLPLGVLYLFFGMPYELRVFYEVYPVIWLMIAHPFLRRKVSSYPLSLE